MIEILITDTMLQAATKRGQYQMNRNSFMKGAGNLPGFLGEEILKSIRPDLELKDTFDYDFISPNGKTIDVKSKVQGVDMKPAPNWMASVAEKSLHQGCDYYIFCRIFKQGGIFVKGWIVGWISKADFVADARVMKKGEQEGDNGFWVVNDCRSLPYSQLREFYI